MFEGIIRNMANNFIIQLFCVLIVVIDLSNSHYRRDRRPVSTKDKSVNLARSKTFNVYGSVWCDDRQENEVAVFLIVNGELNKKFS